MPSHDAWPPKPPRGSLRVPKGFLTLMEVFLATVVKNRPQDPFDFGMKFFERLLRVRTETGHDPILHGAQSGEFFIGLPITKSYTKWGNRNASYLAVTTTDSAVGHTETEL
ncbi:hypothetical protein ACOMHN_036514 [Nucella lapillus]